MVMHIRERVASFLRRFVRRGPPAPGHFVEGRRFAVAGVLDAAPWIWPARDYLVYVPRGYTGWSRRPLVVLLHGCRQTPEEIAAATRIAQVADEYGWLVLLPRQSAKANPWSCWNWFDRGTSAGRGEAAIVRAQVRAARRRFRVHPRRVFIAGLSAGGALAAATALRYPDLFTGVFVHSGLACGAASRPAAAMQVMAQGPDTDAGAIGAAARAGHGGNVRLPLLVVHGERDETVVPAHAVELVRQYLALNGREPGEADGAPRHDSEVVVDLAEDRAMTIADYRDGRRLVARLVRVSRLAHAWSGGDSAYPFNDPHPPDATRLLAEFVEERLRA